MMQQKMTELTRAKTELMQDLKAVIADSEDLLKAAAAVSGESFVVARAKFQEKLKFARANLEDASRVAVEKSKKTAAAADGYVKQNPWTSVGVAATAGLLIGFLTARRDKTPV